jgi:hypothetical protein
LDAVSKALLNRRYVDAKGQPLAAGAPHPYPEFKMMPVRLKLVMSQMAVPKVLAQCANSNMPVEVRQVRIRPDDSGQGLPGGPGGATGTPGSGAPGVPGGPPSGGPEGQPRAAGEGAKEDLTHSLYVPVEILGIIYIYNPPDVAKLRPGVQAGAAGDAAAPPAGPETVSGTAPPAAPGAPAPAGNLPPTAPGAPAPAGNPLPAAPGAPTPAGNPAPAANTPPAAPSGPAAAPVGVR